MNFPPHVKKVIGEIIEKEGGYVNNPNDSGGETKYGITWRTARNYGYTGEMKELPLDTAYDIYYTRYWDDPWFSQVYTSAPAVAEQLFDFGVVAGPARASGFLQRLLNALNRNQKDYSDVIVDDSIGPVTISALDKYLSKRKEPGITVLQKGLTALVGNHFIELSERRPKDEEFLFGWLKHRV